MPLSDYYRTHWLQFAQIEGEVDLQWTIRVSHKEPLPGGDNGYHGEGPKPNWNIRNPFLLVPESASARALAGVMYERQQAGLTVDEWPAGLGLSSTHSAAMLMFSHEPKPTIAPTPQGTLWFAAALEAPKAGKWFRLKYADDAEPTHVWISVSPVNRHSILYWKLAPDVISRIAGNEPRCGYRATLGLQNGPGNDDPSLVTWREEDGSDAEIQVRWTGQAVSVQAPQIAGFVGDGHQLRWVAAENAAHFYGIGFRRRFEIPVGSAVHTRLGLHLRVPQLHPARAIKVEASQILDAEHLKWELRCYYRQDIVDALEWDFTSRLVQVWNFLVARRGFNALGAIRRGAGASVAPLLRARDADSAEDQPDGSGDLDLDGRGWFQAYEFQFAQRASETDFKLVDSGLADGMIQPRNTVEVAARLLWPAVRDTQNRAVKGVDVTIATRHKFHNLQETQGDDGTFFELFITAHTTQAHVRDGALNFAFGGAPEPEAFRDRHFGRVRVLLHLRDEQRPLYLFQWESALADVPVELSYAVEELVWPVLQVQPGAQDARPEDEFLPPSSSGSLVQGAGERAEPALVIALPEVQAAAAEARFLWIANESTNVAQSLRLDLRLEALPITTGSGFSARVVVLDATPQLVAQVKSNFLTVNARDAGSYIVARRSPLSEERDGWEFFDEQALTEGFSLRLPAQALGEQAVKARDDFPTGSIADSRFGPPARLRLAPERLDRGFVAVFWNLRRILLERGSPSPGVPLLEGNFELLYGLAVHLQSSGLLLTELASKLGELPTPALARNEWEMTDPQKDAYEQAWRQFVRAYRAWNSRLGVLEVSHEATPLQPLQLKEGLKYRARVQVAYNAEQNPVWDKGASLAWPRPFGCAHFDAPPPPNTPDPQILLPTEDLAGYHQPDGLRGGAVWGFEQLEIYREFWRQHREGKHSSSGEIANLAFSSLGGFGSQVARFAHDKTIIRSLAAQGRTHVYAVERIGRIAAFWNKAKHVIEYERTAVPSKQFFSEQEAHAGRVLLRKVREYVEILEPERHYPDFSEHERSSCGSVRASAFRSRIIPVHSSWGHTVFQRKPDQSQSSTAAQPGQWEAIGWEIPLWQIGLDPEVYPKPQVCLHQDPPASSDLEFVSGAIEHPHVLYFYTDTREKDDSGKVLTAEVSLWPVIPEVDQTNQPLPGILDIAPCESQDGPGLDAPLPAATAIPPGFERFTFPLEPGDLPADVAGAYFADSGYSGRLRTATMMRGHPKDAANVNRWWGGEELGNDAWNPRRALAKMIRDGNSMAAQAANGFTGLVGKLRAELITPAQVKIEDFRAQAEGWLSTGQAELRRINNVLNCQPTAQNRFQHLWVLVGNDQVWKLWTRPGAALWFEVLEGADGVVTRACSFYDEVTSAFVTELNAIVAQGEEVAARGGAAITTLMDRLKGFSASLEWRFGEAFRIARATIETSSARVSALLSGFFEGQVLQQLDHFAGQAQGNLTAAKALVLQALASARDAALARIRDFRIKLPQGVPDLTPLERVEQRITAVYDAVAAQINAAAGTVDELMQTVDAALRNEITALQAEAEVRLEEIKTQVTALVDAAEIRARDLHADARTVMADAIYRLHELRGIIIDTSKTLTQIQQAIKDQVAAVRADVNHALVGDIQKLLVGQPWDPNVSPDLTKVYGGVLLLDQLFRDIGKYFDSILKDLANGAVGEAVKRLFEALQSAADLEKAIRSGKPEEIIKAATALAEDINAEIGKAAGEVADVARQLMMTGQVADEALHEIKNVLNNARTVWDEFTAPGLGFNRRTIEMVVNFNPKKIEERLGITPCMARVKEFGENLEGLGLRFPVVGLAKRLLPAVKERFDDLTKSRLSKFDFSNLLSDIGGMRLTKLLPMLKMPEWAEDKVKITKGFDKEKLKAWVHAETDIQFTDTVTLMDFGPLLVTLSKGHFTGMVHLEADADGKVQKIARGALAGDWTIAIGGMEFMTYEAVVIRFEGGKLDFDLDPKRMRCPGLLRLMTDVSQTIPFQGGCFKFGLVNDGGIPVGVRADLEVGPFGGSGGVSGISNLLFGGFFELRVFELPSTFLFTIATGFHIGKQEAPFDLQVFILGGGGYLDLAFTYQPLKNALGVDVALAVHASASLRVDVGWLRGGVAIYLGLEAEYHKPPQRPATFSAALFIMIEGYVSIISLITVHLMLRLACTFKSLGGGGTELSGSGMVCVTIRITRFFKISVRKTYTRVIARSGGGGERKLRRHAELAHLAALEAAGGAQPLDALRALEDAPRRETLLVHNEAFRAGRRRYIEDILDPEVRDALTSIEERCARHIAMLAP